MSPALQITRMAHWHSTGTPVLYPGDTAELCAARLKAAGEESAGWTRRRAA